jgi:hypothetical protein
MEKAITPNLQNRWYPACAVRGMDLVLTPIDIGLDLIWASFWGLNEPKSFGILVDRREGVGGDWIIGQAWRFGN